MFHVTRADVVPAVLAEGLRPGSEFGFSSKGGFFKTRQGHVYLCDRSSLAVVEVEGVRAYLQIALGELDPALIDPDEDKVQDSFDVRGAGWVSTPPPVRAEQDNASPDAVGRALAEWADTTVGFDAPDVTAKSLSVGRASYRGTIPSVAIKVATVLSEAAQVFHNGARGVLNVSNLGTAPPPSLGFYKTEVAASSHSHAASSGARRRTSESPWTHCSRTGHIRSTPLQPATG